MSINASAGAKVFIGPTTAAANATAYAALSWTEVKEVESIPEFGDNASLITFTGLSDARVRKRKGAADAGDLAVVCAHDPLDAGQLAMQAAADTKFAYAIKILFEDSADANDTDTVVYFHALVMSARFNVGGVNDITKRTFNLAIDNKPIAVLSVAVA